MNYGLNIKIARGSRGLTQKELSKLVSISQVSLSRMEKGDIMIPYPVIEKLAIELDYPESFFGKIISENETPNSFFYRKRASMKVKDLEIITRKIQIYNKVIDTLLDSVDIPEFCIPQIDCTEDYQADEIAYRLKQHLNIPLGPITKITNMIEKCGIIVHFLNVDESCDKFDGLATFTIKGYPVIYINNNMPNDRKRFSLAHELGHLTMHLRSENLTKGQEEQEKEANLFAGEFLLPHSECLIDFSNMKMRDLPYLKSKWLVSKAAIIHRAAELECIPEDTAAYFYITLGRNKERKIEKGLVPIDTPTIISKMIKMHLGELEYSNDELYSHLGINKTDLNELLGQKLFLEI